MVHRFDGDIGRLRDEHRQHIQPAIDIVRRMAPFEDEVVADLGAGIGYISIPLAGRVRDVIALDANMDMLRALRSSMKERDNKICTVRAELPELPFLNAVLDRVLMVNVFHEVDDKALLVSEVYRVLKKGGVASIVDFQKKETSSGPPVSERFTMQEVLGYFSGFKTTMSLGVPRVLSAGTNQSMICPDRKVMTIHELFRISCRGGDRTLFHGPSLTCGRM